MLRSKPSPYPWLFAAALTALLAGSLFRAYAETSEAFFRMFGTIGLVLVGYFSTRIFYALQEADALERLAAALAHLPDGFAAGPALSMRDPETGHTLVVDLTLVGRRALLLVAIDVTRPVASPSAALARLRRLAARLWRARRLLAPRLTAIGPVPVAAFILTLYRDPPPGGYVDGLAVLTPEGLRQGAVALDETEGAAALGETASVVALDETEGAAAREQGRHDARGGGPTAAALDGDLRARLLSALRAVPAGTHAGPSASQLAARRSGRKVR